MNLSSPLEIVAPTLDAGVLLVLASTTSGCTAAETHRRLGYGSDEGVRRVLARLAKQGIVTVDRTQRYPIYWLNRLHVAAGYIEKLTRLRQDIIDRMAAEVRSWRVQPVYAGLFGSFARGEADADSDIDVLVVAPEALDAEDGESWIAQLARLEEQIHGWSGNPAQLVELTPGSLTTLIRRADPLVTSFRADAIDLFGPRLAELLRELG